MTESRTAYLQRLLEAAKDEQHVIEIGEQGWALQHPTRCFPDLLRCPVHELCEDGEGLRHEPPGRFWLTIVGSRENNDDFLEFGNPAPIETATTRVKALAPTLAQALVQAGKALEAKRRSTHIRLHLPRRHSMDPRRDTDPRYEECQQEPCPETRAALANIPQEGS